MFITFEGLDGSGKTTQIKQLVSYLREQGHDPLATREPGGTPIGDQIRRVLHSVNNDAMTPEAEILLYSASRAQLVGEVIRPALAAGRLVLCDRFYDSTLAYQGYGRGLDLEQLHAITGFATGGLKPDLTFFLDLETEAGLARRHSDGTVNRMDLQERAFYERVRRGYQALVAREPDRWCVVDGNRPVPAIQSDLRRHLLERLRERT